MVHEKANVMEKTTWTMYCRTCQQTQTHSRLIDGFLIATVITSGPLVNTSILVVINKFLQYLIIFEQLPHEE